jgi:ferredoxin
MAEALDAYCHGDSAFATEVFGGETVIGRAVVHETALGDEERPDVLDWERATAIIEEARSCAVSLCYCRHKAEHLGKRCELPLESCLSFNGGADFVIRRKFGRAIERGEAFEILAQSREQGLVQIADNVQTRPTYICNCCGCCCEQLRAISEWDLPAVNPSGFVPAFDEATCKGCSRCARACPITAISMTAERSPSTLKNALKPVIDVERCIGCGLCVDNCRNHAMRMDRRARAPYVPENTVERVLRMALERGHAPRFIDENAGRGHWFLQRTVRALTALPFAARLLASEQLKSRFVRGLLARIKDPSEG